MTVSSDEEYETSSSSTTSSDEEQWSLRVRLLSAVDLPPSLSPAVPLCPWFKFGLVEDIVAALEDGDREDGDSSSHNHERRRSRTILPQRNEQHDSDGDDSKHDDGNHPNYPKSTSKKSSSRSSPPHNNNPIDHLLTTQIPPSAQRTSSSKLMSKSTNGGGGNGADWNEEYRWDALQAPMESALVVKLCTRLAPESLEYDAHGRRGSGGGGGGGSSASSAIGSDDLNTSDHNSSSEEMSQLTSGIRGLWRKGKEQYVEHLRNKGGGVSVGGGAVVTQKEQQAANVAQFLMSSGDHGVSVQQDDLVEYQQKWSERKTHGHSESEGLGGGVDNNASLENRMNAMNNKKKKQQQQQEQEDHYQYSEGLCLGTLSIPFNKLPLEDAVCGNGAAIVERWYQLDDPNAATHNNNNNTSSSRAASPRVGGDLGSLSGKTINGASISSKSDTI